MDPSAPPVGWTDEKSALSQPLPPPYHEYPCPGYPQPGPGYLQPGPGYPQPAPGYSQAAPGYLQPDPGYPQPGPGYPQPGPGYPQPGPGYPSQPQGDMGPPPYGNAAYGHTIQPYPMGQQYPAPLALTAQPKVYVTPVVLASPAEEYICYSIFTMLCCCFPLGIAALIYSISARQANNMGDRFRAEQSSRTARTLNNVALGLGLGVYILTIAFFVVSFVF